jgi:hypothetical protein
VSAHRRCGGNVDSEQFAGFVLRRVVPMAAAVVLIVRAVTTPGRCH